MSIGIISEFRDAYRFLSNFYESPFQTPDGTWFPTAEHFYQCYKTLDLAQRAVMLGNCPKAADIKRAGRTLTLRPDWEAVKIQVMRSALFYKFPMFGNPGDWDLSRRLLATNDDLLVEGNTWGDEFWGVDTRKMNGLNWLGHLLMARRAEVRASCI